MDLSKPQKYLILAEDKRCSMFLQFLAHAQTFDRGVSLHVGRAEKRLRMRETLAPKSGRLFVVISVLFVRRFVCLA